MILHPQSSGTQGRKARIQLEPLGVSFDVDCGSSLETVLAPYGVEFPCGGAGLCSGCRVRVVAGTLAITSQMQQVFTVDELAAGWRLACCARVAGSLTLEVAPTSCAASALPSRMARDVARNVALRF